MDNKQFWEIVRRAGWEKWSQAESYVRGKEAVLRVLKKELPTREDLAAFVEHFYTFKNTLARTIENYEQDHDESCGLGDDGFSDMCAHIIGLGEQAFNDAIEDPACAIRRAQRGDFVECFSYCFPDEQSYSEEGRRNLEKQRQRDSALRELGADVEVAVRKLLERYGEVADIENGWLHHAISTGTQTAFAQFIQRKKQSEE